VAVDAFLFYIKYEDLRAEQVWQMSGARFPRLKNIISSSENYQASHLCSHTEQSRPPHRSRNHRCRTGVTFDNADRSTFVCDTGSTRSTEDEWDRDSETAST